MDSKRSALLSGGSRWDDRSPPVSSALEPHDRELPARPRELPSATGRQSLSGSSAGRWDDRPPPVSPPLEPHEREFQAHPRELPDGGGRPRPDLLGAVRARLGDPLAPVRTAATGLVTRLRGLVTRDALAAVSPLAFARYLVAFFVGVVVTMLWGGLHSTGNEPQRLPMVAATPADVDSVRQSVDKLAAEVSKIRSVEQGILDKVSAPPPAPPPAPTPAPTRASSQRAGSPSR